MTWQAEASELEYWLIGERYIDPAPAHYSEAAWRAATPLQRLLRGRIKIEEVINRSPCRAGEFHTFCRSRLPNVAYRYCIRRNRASPTTGNGRKTVMPEVRRKNLEKEAFPELWHRIN
ncbi:MAG: hypothetical protein H6821_17415 [Planctomycetaceae bacterium]|nr:hypothetical protein [Planctomycetaceae bacterium]